MLPAPAPQDASAAEVASWLRHEDRFAVARCLLSLLAHETGTSLNVVQGRAALLAGTEGSTPEDVRKGAVAIGDAAHGIIGALERMLEFARRQPQVREDVAGATLRDSVLSVLGPLLDERRIEVRWSLPPELVGRLFLSKAALVLLHVIENAALAMASGGTIDVALSREDVVTPRAPHATRGVYLVLRVRDDGPGVPETLPRAPKRGASGAPLGAVKDALGDGLGLFLCRRLAREHGGWLEMETSPGSGTTLTVYLFEGDRK